jgi:ribosomal protein S27AE
MTGTGPMMAASFICPRCGAESFNPSDIAERYCGRCHAFVDDPPASCVDEAFPERPCDRCGKPYRGPAVYCSLTCALADA